MLIFGIIAPSERSHGIRAQVAALGSSLPARRGARAQGWMLLPLRIRPSACEEESKRDKVPNKQAYFSKS